MKSLLLLPFLTFYNLLNAQTGPGGVSTTNGTGNLVLWLKANTINLTNGTNVSNWADQSGYNNNAAADVGREPTFATGVYNGQPSINFTAVNTDFLKIADATSLKPNNISIFCVGKYTTGTTAYSPFVIKTNTYSWTEGYGLALNSGANATYTFVNNWSQNFISVSLAINTPTIFSTIYDNVNVQLFHNEASQGVDPYAVNISNSNNNLYLGISPDGAGTGVQAPLNGDIAEVIIINRNINAAERIIINNYLSSKYNLPLSANDIYDEDDAVNGNFDFDVAGIGRVNATSIHNDAKGDIVRINTPADLGDNEFLVWGHNNLPITPTVTTDIPVGIQARAGRTWRASETGDVGAVTIQFDLNAFTVANAADLRLLIDTDNDGLFTNETPIAGAINAGTGLYEFQTVAALGNNMRFTIATVNVLTLPIKITDFKLSAINNKNVKVEWTFAADNTIDYFEVEHSKNGSQWLFVAKQINTASSNANITYDVINNNAYGETSFYKLKIVYKDGHIEYSDIKSIQLSKGKGMLVYPIPAINTVTVEGAAINKNEITVFNLEGQNVTNSILMKQVGSSKMEINISNLIKGAYFIKIGTTTQKFIKK
jgi:hypothetical protein